MSDQRLAGTDTRWKVAAGLIGIALACLSFGGCRFAAAADDAPVMPAPTGVTELRRYCIERHGGFAMDAVDVYGGRLALRCSRWAYGQAQSWRR